MNGREVDDNAVGLDMPNGLASNIDYKQKFVYHANPNKPGPTNSQAKKVPSDVLEGME